PARLPHGGPSGAASLGRRLAGAGDGGGRAAAHASVRRQLSASPLRRKGLFGHLRLWPSRQLARGRRGAGRAGCPEHRGGAEAARAALRDRRDHGAALLHHGRLRAAHRVHAVWRLDQPLGAAHDVRAQGHGDRAGGPPDAPLGAPARVLRGAGALLRQGPRGAGAGLGRRGPLQAVGRRPADAGPVLPPGLRAPVFGSGPLHGLFLAPRAGRSGPGAP
ncbi:hypothetical protein H632_c4514p0, partial [Helicosporidium sp. ATCC 50920]